MSNNFEDNKEILNDSVIMNKSKKKIIGNIIIISSLTLAIILSTIIGILFHFNSNELPNPELTEKMILNRENVDYELDEHDKEKNLSLYNYGVIILVDCDYVKHPKYDEWIKAYEMNGDYGENDSTQRNENYYFCKYINNCFIETIKDAFPNPYNISGYIGAQSIILNYSLNDDPYIDLSQAKIKMKNYIKTFYKSIDFYNLKELSKEEYILKIDISEQWPIYTFDEEYTKDNKLIFD